MAEQSTIWGFYPGFHVGADGDFSDDVFYSQGLIGTGWPLTGSLQSLVEQNSSVSDFVNVVRRVYENHKDIPTWTFEKREKWFRDSAGTLHRFLSEAKQGDIVVYACKADRQVYVGKIKNTLEGRYKHIEKTDNPIHWHCNHFRAVEWLAEISYDLCTRQELFQARTQNKFWRMKSCPEKFLMAM